MIGLAVQITDNLAAVAAEAKKANFRNLGHAAASIRKAEQAEFEVSALPSSPGEPPHTRAKQLPNAIAYDVNEESAVIGPRASVAGDVGAAHEFGGEFRGQEYPERPFALPALEASIDRFAAEWQGSIGE